MINLPMTNRTCDGCTICCTVMAVQELGKPYNCRCEHITSDNKRCEIYQNRPDNCRVYECLWLASEINISPKESGILYNLEKDEGGWWIEIYEAQQNKLTLKLISAGLASAYRMQNQYLLKFCGVKIYPHGSKPGVDFNVAEKYKCTTGNSRTYMAQGTSHGFQIALFVGNRPENYDASQDVEQTRAFWALLKSRDSNASKRKRSRTSRY